MPFCRCARYGTDDSNTGVKIQVEGHKKLQEQTKAQNLDLNDGGGSSGGPNFCLSRHRLTCKATDRGREFK